MTPEEREAIEAAFLVLDEIAVHSDDVRSRCLAGWAAHKLGAIRAPVVDGNEKAEQS